MFHDVGRCDHCNVGHRHLVHVTVQRTRVQKLDQKLKMLISVTLFGH